MDENKVVKLLYNYMFSFIEMMAEKRMVIASLFGFFVGTLLGCIIGYILKSLIKHKLKIFVRKLDNVVLCLSFIGAAICIVLNLCYKENNVSVQILGFYTSFIFSWLLTKKGAKEEFQNTQHKIAKSTYRHIEDVETAVLVTRDRLLELKGKRNITKVDIDGILDNTDIILTGIRSNKEDWRDLLKPSYIEKINEQEDPEAKLNHEKEIKTEKINKRRGKIEQPKNLSEIKQAVSSSKIRENKAKIKQK